MMNFHGQIAVPLEEKARKLLGYEDRPVNTIFDADNIQNGLFVEVMILLLRVKSSYQANQQISNFIKKCTPYIGYNGIDLEESTAYSLYQEFCALFEKN